MNLSFKLESELVDNFLLLYSKHDSERIVVESPIRFGNIDIVSIKNYSLPFNDEQVKVLSKPSAALVYTKIKNKRPVSATTLKKEVGLSKSTFEHTLCSLKNTGLIKINKKGFFLRKEEFNLPKVVVTGYEAKLRDFNKAFYQAKSNKEFVDYSYLVFPLEIARKLLKKRLLMTTNGIGLIGVSKSKKITLLKARQSKEIKNYVRLLNIVKTDVISE